MNDNDEYPGSDEHFEPQRAMISISVGSFVRHGDVVYRIAQLLDFSTVIGVNLDTGRHAPLRIGELRPVERPEAISYAHATDINDIADEDWKVAQERYAAIKPFIEGRYSGRRDIKKRAEEVGINAATLYRWIQRYSSYGNVGALIPMKRGWGPGRSRISPEVEAIIEDALLNHYLTSQRLSVSKTIELIDSNCRKSGIQPPNHMTVRARIARLPERTVLRERGHKEKARNKFNPVPGAFPNADYPLSVIQIDHTLADVILVDDIHRKPIGRPWMTLAIDVYSRMITGYYISLDAPSETSVAMCVAHSMLPKEEWIMLHKIDAEWPVWGKPATIHVDNGPDFRSDNFRKSCSAYGINLEFRPVKRPRYGGHIERLMGTVLKKIHGLPGTTFSNIRDRVDYDSDKHAVMTKGELETWLLTYITKVYHQKLHAGIGLSPLKKWDNGIFGDTDIPGAGMPPRPSDRMTLQLDFMPSITRTIQAFGVTWKGLRYYGDSLRPWINFSEPTTGKKREFIFRYDPRDISILWFFDPELKSYFRIPYADQSLPSMSLWEHQQVRQKLKEEGKRSINQHTIDAGLAEMRQLVETASQHTRKARRQLQRHREHQSGITPAAPSGRATAANLQTNATENAAITNGLETGDIDSFGDIA